MRAVNLVPPESRVSGLSGGKSGGAAYGVVGALAVVLVAVFLLSSASRDKARAQQELANVQQATQSYQQVANQYAAFTDAASKTAQRITLVRSISEARFDWAGALRDLSRLVPATAQIQKLDASVKDGVGAGGGSKFRSDIPTPAISIEGCSKTQATVADLVTRLQAMRRVTNVALETSSTDSDLTELSNGKIKPLDDTGSTASSAGSSDQGSGGTDCSLKKPFYKFVITVFYTQGKAASADSVGATTPSPQTASATTPAATTPAGN